jgi:hypothetical protein
MVRKLRRLVTDRPVIVHVAIALLVGVFGFHLSLTELYRRDRLAADFTWSLRAAEIVIQRGNPYTQLEVGEHYPVNSKYFYPPLAALLAVPFTFIRPMQAAGALFFGISSTLMAYALLARGDWHKLPVFASAAFFVSASVAQWSPLILAATLLPGLSILLSCKPNIGIAGFFYNPTKKSILGIVIGLLVGFVIVPGWPVFWFRNVLTGSNHLPPMLVLPLGPLLLLSALFWRKPEGRLMLAYSLIPSFPWLYDPLLLWLIPRSFLGSMMLTGVSWAAYYLVNATQNKIPATVNYFYIPALLILLFEIWRARKSPKHEP